MTTNTGGPAFPSQSIGPDFPPGWGGMTLRDYFAAKAMQAYCSRPDVTDDMTPAATARMAYAMADAMLAARGEP